MLALSPLIIPNKLLRWYHPATHPSNTTQPPTPPTPPSLPDLSPCSGGSFRRKIFKKGERRKEGKVGKGEEIIGGIWRRWRIKEREGGNLRGWRPLVEGGKSLIKKKKVFQKCHIFIFFPYRVKKMCHLVCSIYQQGCNFGIYFRYLVSILDAKVVSKFRILLKK